MVTLTHLYERQKILVQKTRKILRLHKYQTQPVLQIVSIPLPQKLELESQIQNSTSEFTRTPVFEPSIPTQNENDNIPRPIKLNVNVQEYRNNDLNFSSDDSVADP